MAGSTHVRRMRSTRVEPSGGGFDATPHPRVVRRTANPRPGPEWEDLATREPRLSELLSEARGERAHPGVRYCANETWFGWRGRRGIKPRLVGLVGWHAGSRDPVLTTATAYDLAYRTVYGALPDCRGCGCPGAPPVEPDAAVLDRLDADLATLAAVGNEGA